jgi:hypothetical protein
MNIAPIASHDSSMAEKVKLAFHALRLGAPAMD